jgi:hypothetical protein
MWNWGLILAFCVILFAYPVQAQNVDYGPFPGNVYLNFGFGYMVYTPNISDASGPIKMYLAGVTVQRNLVVRSDTIGSNGVGEPILAGRFSLSWGPALYVPAELNLKLLFSRRPGALYVSAGITTIWFGSTEMINEGCHHCWMRDIPSLEPYYALGLGIDMHPHFTAEFKWWHAFENRSVRNMVNEYRKDWIVNIDIYSLTIGIPL